MNRIIRTTLLFGAVLVMYGYICRIAGIYFFWDSKVAGWILVFVGLFIALVSIHRSWKQQGRKTGWIKLVIGLFIFAFLLAPFTIYMMKSSDAYDTATNYLQNDRTITKEVGPVKGFGMIPTGWVSTATIHGTEYGDAEFTLVVQGDRKYKDVTIRLTKAIDSSWQVTRLD